MNDHLGSSSSMPESLSEAAHTPGPWEKSGVWVMSATADVMVAKADYHEVPFAVAQENARLIAAAPELLEVVRGFVDEKVDYMRINHLGDPERTHMVKWARQIIAKATT
jgi:hypothetical protein